MRYEQDDERKQRLNKIAAATVGIIAGGALLKREGGMKYISKAFGDISSTMKKVTKDVELTGRKGLTADKISELFKKHISNEDSTWKLARKNNIQTIDIKNTGLFKDLNQLEHIAKDFGQIRTQRIDNAVREEAMEALTERFKDIKERDRDFMKDLYNLTDRSLKRKDIFFEQTNDPGVYKAMIDEFKEAVKGTRLEGKEEEITDILTKTLNNVEQIEKRVDSLSKETQEQIQNKVYESIKERYSPSSKVINKDRAATASDIYEALQEQKAVAQSFDDDMDNFLDYLGKKLKDNPEIGELEVDPKKFRMTADNQFYSLEDLRKIQYKAIDAFSETIPGKLFGVKNFVEETNKPNFFFMAKGTFDPGMAALQGGKDLLEKDMVYIGDKFYEVTSNGIEHFEKADGRTFISGKAGTKFGLLDRMSGNSAERLQTNKFLSALDINTKGGDFVSEIKSVFTKFKKDEGKEWNRNLVKRLSQDYSADVYTVDDVENLYRDIKSLSKMYNETTKEASVKTIESLKKTLSSESIKILKTLDADDPLEAYKSLGIDVLNKDLKTLLKKITKNPDLKNTMTRSTSGTINKRVIKYDEILKRELIKEAIFQDIKSNKSTGVDGLSVTLAKIQKANLSKTEHANIQDLMNWGILQEKGEIFSKDLYRAKTFAEKENTYLNISRLFRGKNQNAQEDMFLKEFRESVIKFGKENTSVFQKLDINKNKRVGYDRPQWMTVKKTINPLDIIKSINDDTKNTNELVQSFIKQFNAGRNNMEDVTNLSFIPYHMVNRLTTPLETFGLGFSNKSTGSALDIAKNIGLKRILPVAALMYGASYLNYRAEAYTGTSFTEAYENAKAQFGLGARILTSPLDNYFDRQREFNPIAKYWLGDHKDKDEYLDYLEYGYDPVRKGRFWSFGSASEFRGGKISYWEPNKLRQAHSHYRDIAIYGSEDEKWKHSLIPTPRHPFSTIRYLMDPYWLENKHYNDRPYPVTGKMFSEGTPWGAILNPTIGELIKPQKRMHQEHLQGTALDVRSIIQARNDAIKNKSQENRIVRIDESGFTPMAFTPESMPSMSEAVYSIKVDKGRIVSAGFEGQQYAETMNSVDEARPLAISDEGSIMGQHSVQYGTQRLVSAGGHENKMAASWLSGIASLVTSGAMQGHTAVSMIKELNLDIRTRAEAAQKGEWFERANEYKDPYKKETFSKKQDYLDSMINMDTKTDFVHDMIYSTKQLSGMYGFLFDQILPPKQGYRLEQAGKMSSFTRQFWDEAAGGLGGNFMEIARRFFPHEDHNITNINPIRNTQEEWLPSRFLTGDPYTKLPKGEARLPGAGYEALNKLHSDKYGKYGAFDRYKILADIAPLSEEYKTWKKIAKAEVKDPFLIKQMNAIEDRVKEQIKEHDFYNYKFLGKHMASTNAVIEEVSNTGKIKILGSNQTFSLAGIKVLKDEEGNSQVHKYLKPGMKVKLEYEDNDFNNKDSAGNISAIVKVGYQNINQEMFENKAAKEKDNKETLADERFNLTDLNVLSGHIWEAIGHAPIPFIHNKFMRIDSSLESYKKEQVYGTPYSTWDHPIKGFVKPAFQQAFAESPIHQAIGLGTWALSEYLKEGSDNKIVRKAADAAFALSNPAAFAGGVIGALPKMKISDEGIWNARNGARIGALVGVTGYALTNTQNPLLSMANFAAIGVAAQHQFKFEGLNHGKAALIGAGIGLTLSALNPESSITDLNKKYIPEDTKKKWDIEEYYDRLEYIKYTNLYHLAAKKAKSKEGVDVERIVNQYERNKEKNAKIIQKLEKQKIKANKLIDEQAKEKLIASIDARINELLTPIQYLKAGEYTKSAIAYKKAAETTIYGLSEDATTADVLRSLPKYDRDYFLDFANEKDPKKRKKILKYVSPYKAKALKIMWGEKDIKEPKDNKSYFHNHNLPNLFWSGWKSTVDLDNVKMKTIENEGMLLSDFGMYDSAKNEPAAIMAPEIKDIHKHTDTLSLQANMISLMNGAGFQNVDVSVERTNRPGIQMVANLARVASYNLNNAVSSTLSNLIL